MSTVIAIWLPSKKTKRCPLDSDNDVLWLMSWKSFVVCDSWFSSAAWDTSLQFISPNNTVQPGCALVAVNYPAWVLPNKEDCDKQKYVKVKMDSSCQVGAGIIWQCLIININKDYQNPSVSDPFWVNSNQLSENGGTVYTDYIKIATRWTNDATNDPTYTDERCFDNELLQDKRDTCSVRVQEAVAFWDAIAFNPWTWRYVRTDSNINWVRQFFCWIALNSAWANWLVKMQWKWCIDVSMVRWLSTGAIDWCAYLSTGRWQITSTTPTDNRCFPVWKILCGKLHISPMAGCLAELGLFERLKAIESAQVPQCNIIVWNRNIFNFQWSFAFNSWWFGFAPRCVDVQTRFRSFHLRMFDWLNGRQIRALQKIDWKMCGSTGEVAWCSLQYFYPWSSPFAAASAQPEDIIQANWLLWQRLWVTWQNGQELDITVDWTFNWNAIQLPTTFTQPFTGNMCFIIKARN